MTQTISLENPLINGLGPTAFRKIGELDDQELLPNLVVVSADTHYEIKEDIFYENFPAPLKQKAPRVWLDEYIRIGNPNEAEKGTMQAIGEDPTSELLHRIMTQHNGPGVYQQDLRQQHMHIDGVHKEIAFPQSVNGFFNVPDLEIRELMFRIYNEHVAKQQALRPHSFFPVGICSNWWDPEKAREAIGQIKSLGLKTFMIPINPGKYRSGKGIAWADIEMEQFWTAVEDSGLPACFHIQENIADINGRGKYPAWVFSLLEPFRKPFGQMAFGGVFDRNPGLKIVFAEAGISWVAPALQDAEMIFDSFGTLIDPRPKHRPSYYWHKNCFATFQSDRLGLEMLKYIGADTVMWGSDYPHTEGTYGYTRASQKAVLDATNESDARKILGGNAIRVFGL